MIVLGFFILVKNASFDSESLLFSVSEVRDCEQFFGDDVGLGAEEVKLLEVNIETELLIDVCLYALF